MSISFHALYLYTVQLMSFQSLRMYFSPTACEAFSHGKKFYECLGRNFKKSIGLADCGGLFPSVLSEPVLDETLQTRI